MPEEKAASPLAGHTPAAAPAVPAPAALASSAAQDQITAMLQILLQREARAAAKEEAEETAKKARDAQRQRNAESHYDDAKANQVRCNHLKGGKNRRPTQAKDFAVYIHTYINHERVIKCQLCKMKWKIRDTKDFLIRYGKKIANHTGIGWNEAMEMLAQTSNQPSSSEIPMSSTPVITTEEV